MKRLILASLATALLSSTSFASAMHRPHRHRGSNSQVTAKEYVTIAAIAVHSIYTPLKPGHR